MGPTLKLSKPWPVSCDTFVALPPTTADGSVIFGKNSDRVTEEVQEVVAYPSQYHTPGVSLRCTYITIPQAPRTLAVVLSKPSWMWGAEMGANERGVVVGNEAVWTVEDSDGPPALLGMDLVRLALERGSTAEEAVQILTSLLEEHGQGGPCEEGGSWTYHNSFLVADAQEAWVVETAGRWWVAQRITEGFRNISNCLSIRTVFDRCSEGLQAYARQQGYWDGKGDFDWAAAFSEGGAPPLGRLSPGREANGHRLLQRAAPKIDVHAMMAILRDEGSGICMSGGGFRSNGSQVSRLVKAVERSAAPTAQHWFTATPEPLRSIYKPFSFSTSGRGDGDGEQVDGHSAEQEQQSQQQRQRQQRPADESSLGSPYTGAQAAARNPPHPLWLAWQSVYEKRGGSKPPLEALQELEERGLDCSGGLSFAKAVEEEMRLYGGCFDTFQITVEAGGSTVQSLQWLPQWTVPPYYLSIKGLQNGVQHKFKVQALSKALNGGGEASVAAMPCANSPPAPPTDLKAAVGDGELSLSWSRPADGRCLTEFRVQVLSGGGNAVQTLSVAPTWDGPTLAVVRGLTNGQAVQVLVKAVNGKLNDGGEATIIAVPCKKGLLPSAPVDLKVKTGDGQAILSWSNPSNGACVDSFQASVLGGTQPPLTVVPQNMAGASYTVPITGLANGIPLQFSVKAVSQQGPGESVTVTSVPCADIPPSRPTGLAASSGDGQATLSWGPPTNGACLSGYQVLAAANNQTLQTLAVPLGMEAANNITLQSLPNGSQVKLVVKAVSNKFGAAGEVSTAVVPCAPIAPSPPTQLTAKPGHQVLLVSWAKPDNGACLSEYQVIVAAEGQPPLTLSAPPQWDGPQSLPVTGLVNGARYNVSVVAKAAGGNASDEAVTTGTPQAVCEAVSPSPPSRPNVTTSDQRVTVCWGFPDNKGCVESYRLTLTNPATNLTRRYKTGFDYNAAGGCLSFGQLQNGLTYSFEVQAWGGAAMGGASVTVLATPERPVPKGWNWMPVTGFYPLCDAARTGRCNPMSCDDQARRGFCKAQWMRDFSPETRTVVQYCSDKCPPSTTGAAGAGAQQSPAAGPTIAVVDAAVDLATICCANPPQGTAEL
ncbi:hypothetical protein N2152v2_004265 [Parachlorella kessleri]